MSKASCCCGLSPSAALEPATMGNIEIKATKRPVQKRFCDARPLSQISRNIPLSQNAGPPGSIQTANSFAGKLPDQTLLRLSHPYLLSFAAITSISTRNPGLASDATPTTDRAGRLG